ncbi:hypothetical protein BATDEDRAFT_84646 [Batrachochytrium dendrobatidis JAM81]|uniref:PHD-type domain-containing protein n=2 Tax=Batrachochytrium dendrobatidis TaxID=109871 RepID=F4NTH8_BATDJ|nr:uncharacterized protein BATDEDRAFT_84646 [Batrachochytrium dendrobatidis JAM81]EGF83924.1 hypothetical protein BATDEDRAFT_84646 [Batrachochytrium dendrobatidis JAM81]KAJ8331337.1 hypothetical protein O5D80_000269 [Batrachochytrium dendrobatidis]KAK5671786.1 hypothetical protein QVD99_001621 [Batrachochytrium dendrobatidis]OAJ36216.1 hypothetical protein BDEG_20412 [Batrachochytrium dendrobatidis JEL423]|eukprot:XP_006676276.1 hypothetical protein BATDEDRAFT_84646 [Batrachochytrium dendrobatidis JAM81]
MNQDQVEDEQQPMDAFASAGEEQEGDDENEELDHRQRGESPVLTASGRPTRAAALKKTSPQKPSSTPISSKRRRRTTQENPGAGQTDGESDAELHLPAKSSRGRPGRKPTHAAESGLNTEHEDGMDVDVDSDARAAESLADLNGEADTDDKATGADGAVDAISTATSRAMQQADARRRAMGEHSDMDTDEDADLDVDPKGEAKISKDGFLLGGREFRIKTFTLPRHPTRLYMFSLEASKILGFRDTYIFFLRNPMVRRVNGDEPDRDFLRDQGLLPSQLRNRPITLVTARNLFRVFGHKIIRRGKPVRDDYFVGDQVEPLYYPEPRQELDDDADFTADFIKTLSSTEGGPFTRQSAPITILGFNHTESPMERFEPLVISQELRQDSWMLKCALSAAEFNQRLNKLRPTRFFDLHTNIEQIPLITQPMLVNVEMREGSEQRPFVFDKALNIRSPSSKPQSHWINVSDDVIASKYPLAIAPQQYQGAFSLYRERFSEKDGACQDQERVPLSIQKQMEVEVQAPAIAATPFSSTVGFNPSVQAEPQPRKRSERSRVQQGSTEPEENVCCHCFAHNCPVASDTIPSDLLLNCTQCGTKHHPRCIEFEDKVLITKVMTFDWRCSNCKLCTVCNNAGDDDKLLFCDTCDRGYHMYCLNPPLEVLPEGSWLCSECAVCKSCKKRPEKQEGTEDMWRHVVIPPSLSLQEIQIKPPPATSALGTYLCTYCTDCYDHFEADRFCPLCIHVYSEDSDDLAMVCCDECDRWVHVGCDPELTDDVYQKLVEQEEPAFTCALCDTNKREQLLETRRVEQDGIHLSTVEFKKHFLVAPPLVNK